MRASTPTQINQAANPTPTGKLDEPLYKKKWNFRSSNRAPYKFQDAIGRRLVIKNEELGKAVYCHQIDLGMEILVDRVPCPIQSDPNKFARTDCSAVTDRGMDSVLEKIVDISTHMGQDLILAEAPMEFYPKEKALYYIEPSTGAAPYFHLEKNGEFQFWSARKFTEKQLTNFLNDPQTVVRPPFNSKFNQNEL